MSYKSALEKGSKGKYVGNDYDKAKDIGANHMNYGVDDSYIKSYQDYYSKNFGNAGRDYNSMEYGNSKPLSDEYSARSAELNRMGDRINAYMNSNKRNIDPATFNAVKNMVMDSGNSARNISKSFSQKNDSYSSFSTKEEYDNYLAAVERNNYLKNMDVAAEEATISSLSKSLEKNKYVNEKKYGLPSVVKDLGYTSMEEAKEDLTKKQKDVYEAKKVQATYNLEQAAKNDPEYSKYASAGNAIENPTMKDANGFLNMKFFNNNNLRIGAADIANPVTYARDNLKGDTVAERNAGDAILSTMTADEVKVYNYYVGKGDKDSANSYLDSLREDLNNRFAQRQYNEYYKDSDAMKLAYSVVAGANQIENNIEGIGAAIRGETHIDNSVNDYLTSYVRSGIDNKAEQFAFDVISNAVNQVPSILAGTAAGAAIGGLTSVRTARKIANIVSSSVMGAGAFGSSYESKVNEGYSKDKALTYATVNAALETELSRLLGGIANVGGRIAAPVSDSVKSAMQNGVKEASKRFALEYGADFVKEMGSEFVEEGLQEILDPIVQNLIFNETTNEVSWSDALYSGLIGAASAGLMQGVSAPIELSKYKSEVEQYRPYEQNLINAGLNQQKDTEAFKTATKYKEKLDAGEETNTYDLAELVNNNVDNMEDLSAKESEDVTPVLEEEKKSAQETVKKVSVDEAFENLKNKNIDDASLQQIKSEYDGSISAEEFAKGMSDGFNYGFSGVPRSAIENTTFYSMLNDMQKNHSYQLGVNAAKAKVDARKSEIVSGYNGKTGRKRGVVKSEGITLKGLRSKFNDTQNTAYKILSEISDATGFDITLYNSEANENGIFEGAQGQYNRSTNDIKIDINAGILKTADVNDLAKYTMLRTFGHEITHVGENWAPEEYDVFRKMVFNALSERGENPNDLIELKMAMDKNLTYDGASREVVSESMTDILPDSNFIRNIAENNQKLFEKLYNKLKEFVDSIRAYFNSIGHNRAREANALKEERDGVLRYLDEIVAQFDKMMETAVNNYQLSFAVDEEVNTESKEDTKKAETTKAETKEAEETKTEEKPSVDTEQKKPEKKYLEFNDEEKRILSEAMMETMGKLEHVYPTEIYESTPRKSNTEIQEETSAVDSVSEAKTETVVDPMIKNIVNLADKKALRLAKANIGGETFFGTAHFLYKVNEDSLSDIDLNIMDISGNALANINEMVKRADTKLTGPAYKYKDRNCLVFNNPDAKWTVAINEKYAKMFDGNDFYYDTKAMGALAIKDSDGNLVGILMPVSADGMVSSFDNLPISNMKSFKAKKGAVKNGGKNENHTERVREADTNGERASRLLDEVEAESVRGDVPEGTASETPSREGEGPARNGDRLDAERNGSSGSDGSSEGGDLRRNDGVIDSEEAARKYAESKGYSFAKNPLAEMKSVTQIDIDSPEDFPLFDPVIIEKPSDWQKVADRIDAHEFSPLREKEKAHYEKMKRKKEQELNETVDREIEQKSTENPKGNNFVIDESLNLPSGEKNRFRANLDAIKLVKQLQTEGRYATPEEQIVLSKYVGWGGLSNAFGEMRWNSQLRKSEMVAKKGWEEEFAEFRKLVDDGVITEQEYSDASASTKNAHYTSVEVIKAMYDGLSDLGFNGGSMLEPSSGVGNFVGAMPATMTSKVKSWTMVELDSITGNIAKYLYPNSDVRIEGFEKANIPDNYMDVAIGNVPFGNYGIVDRTYPKRVTKAIHNYFFAKSLDKVRPGGLVMFITSSFTMNGKENGIRQYIMDRADLIGAIRLPNTAFAGNAGTQVVTDILVLKKREAGTPYTGEAFLEAPLEKVVEGSWQSANVNEYFINHPEMVLGVPEFARGMYGPESLTYGPLEGKGSLGDQIRTAFKNIDQKMEYKAKPTPEKSNFNAQRADKKTKNNGLIVNEDGSISQNNNGTIEKYNTDNATAKRIAGMLKIRDAYKTLVGYLQQGQTDNLVKKARKDLNTAYDEFVKEHGFINSPKNKSAIEVDPDSYSICALENYDAKKKTATKADIFTKNTISANRTVSHVDDIASGVIVSINTTGGVDASLIAKLTDRSEEDVTRELIDSRMAFKTRDGLLESPEVYLSGNVRAKLREAEALEKFDPDYTNNVEELKKVVPADIPFNDIYVTPGSPWIPDEVYADFIAEMLGGQNNPSSYRGPDVTVSRTNTGEFKIAVNNSMLKQRYQNTQQYGTNRRTFLDIISAMMSSTSLTVKDYVETESGGKKSVINKDETAAVQAKAEEIAKEFSEWLWKEENRKNSLASLYNETYNAFANPKYDGSGLTVNGISPGYSLREHQANAVQRIIASGGNTLLAHKVGAGKTLEMASAAMKLRELGIVKKPVFVVPKSLVAQWGVEFKNYFPAARLLVSDDNSFAKANRKIFTNKIANGDYDAVIISYEQFEKVPMSTEYQRKFYQEQIDEIIAAIAEEKAESGKGITVKEMEKRKAQLEKKISDLTTKSKDEDNIDFEQLGIDSLFVDEAHNFKNLQYTTRMSNVAGLGNANGSQRAFDLYTKVRYLQGLNGGRGVVFATATPIMNSMSEMYIMQKYLQSDTLNQLGLRTFDAWAKQFGEVVNALEIKPSGQGYRLKQTFSKFKNLSELQLLFRGFTDVLTDVPGLKIPKMKGGKVNIVTCEMGQFQKDFMKQLEKRSDNIKKVDPKDDNMLKITSDGKKISYTQRMIDPSLPYEPGCKIYKCCENVVSEYKESKAEKGTQIIFCDMATPKGGSNTETSKKVEADVETVDEDSVRLYEDMKNLLIKNGIPAKEIAFIHDADTDQKRKQLFSEVNEGKVRVLIGSTGKMGVGMNAQKRIVAIHHLDAPWRPGDIEQRDGRAFRQGNINDRVTKYTYVTEGSFDARLWDSLDRKQRFISQIMNGEDVGRTVEDTGEVTVSAAEIKAISSGNPLIMEQVQLTNDISNLESLQKAFNSSVTKAKAKITEDTQKIAILSNTIENAKADIKSRTDTYSDSKFSMTIGSKKFTDKKDAGAVLVEVIRSKANVDGYVTVGSFAGFEIRAIKKDAEYFGRLAGKNAYDFNVYMTNTTQMINKICEIPKTLEDYVKMLEGRLAETKTDLAAQQSMAEEKFAKKDELDQKRKRFDEIMAVLNPPEEQMLSDDETQNQSRNYLEGNDEYNDLAEKISSLYYSFDTYDYNDEYTGSEEIDIANALRNGDTSYIDNIREVYDDLDEDEQKIADEIFKTYEKLSSSTSLDSDGNKLTKKQQEYFKDSKVRDKNGNLLVLYHGTDSSFSTFAPRYAIGFGKGIYLTDNKNSANDFGSNIMKVFANLKNPFDSRFMTPSDIESDVKKTNAYKNYNKEYLDEYGKDADVYDIYEEEIGVFNDALRELGYDGIIAENSNDIEGLEVVAFEPNQVKDVTNTTPTSNPDIQFQQRTGALTDREILEVASENIKVSDLTEGEKAALDIFKNRLGKLNDLQIERAEQGRLYKEQQFGSNVNRSTAKETLNRMHILDSKIKTATSELLSVEEKEVLKRVLKKSRDVIEQQDRKKANETLTKWREARKNSDAIKKYRERIKVDVKDLSDWILRPDNKDVVKHVPDVVKNAVIPFLTSIDFTSKRQLSGKEATLADKQFDKNVLALKGAIKENIDAQGLYSGYNDLPADFMDNLQDFIDLIHNYVSENSGEYVINKMTGAELRDLAHIVQKLKKYITQMNVFHSNAVFSHVYDAGNNTMSTLSGIGNSGKHVGEATNFLMWQQMKPAYAFERFGAGGKAIYDELRNAQGTLAFNAKKIINFTNDTYTDKEVKECEDNYKKFNLGGDIVRMPISYMMSFYELSKQPDSLRHILGEGVRVATYKDGKNTISDNGHVITEEDLKEIVDALTPRQKEIADALQKYMATQGAEWGNYVSVRRFGEAMFTNPQYFPINSDGRHLESTAEEMPSNASLYALLNMSFTKRRNEEADNRIVLYSIFDVFANHMASMAQYNAFSLPILDALKWLNYKTSHIDDETGKRVVTGSVREELARVYGVPEESRPGKGREGYAETFIKNIIRAYNGTEAQGIPTDSIGIKALRQYNMAQIAYNLRVVVQQPMSIARAGLILDYSSILQGLKQTPKQIKENAEEMVKHSGIAAWKSLGFYDINISRGLTETIKHKRTVLDRVNEVGMIGAEKADEITWSSMWNACKYEVSKNNKNLVPGSKEYFNKVSDLFEEVIYKTQVVDSVLTKNEFMRSKGYFSRAISSFMSEPVTTISSLTSAYFNYQTDLQRGMSRSEAWQKNGKTIARTCAVYSVSAIVLAAVQSVIDGLRDTDDDPYTEKYFDAFVGNVIDELMPFNKLPILSDFYDIAKELVSIFGVDTYGNPPQTIIAQWYNSLIKGTEIMYTKLSGKNTGYTWYAGISKLLQAASGITGLPMSAATREVVTIWNNTVGAIDDRLKVKTYERKSNKTK